MNLYYYVFCLSTLITTLTFGQKSLSGFPKLTDQKLNMTVVDFEKDADAVVLDEEGFMEITHGGYDLFVKKRIKILTEKGIDNANIELTYYSKNNHESISQIKGQTINIENGQYVSDAIDPKEIFEVNINNYYSAKRFALPNVKVGSIIEYQYKVYNKGLYLIDAWDFQHDIPTLSSKFNIKITAGLDYTNLLIGKRIAQKYKGKKGLETWELINVPSIKELKFVHNVHSAAEKMRLQLSGYHSDRGYVSTISKWDDLKKELLESNDLYLNPQAVKKYAASIPDGTSEFETFTNVIKFFHKDFKWNNFIGIYTNKPQKEILDTHTGNLAELNTLLNSILKVKNIDAKLILLASRSKGKLITNFPYMDQFDVMVNQINLKDGSNYLINAAAIPENDYRYAPLNLFNDYGFDISTKEDRFLQLNQFLSKSETTFKYSFKQGKAIQSRKDVFDGYFFNAKLKSENQIHQYITAPINVINDEKKEVPVAYSDQSYKTLNISTMDFDLNSPFIALENPLSHFINSYVFDDVERSNPIEFNFPYYFKIDVFADVPTGYEVTWSPDFKSIVKSSDDLVYSQNAVEKNGKVQILYEFYLGKAKFDSKDYKMVKSFFENVQKDATKQILFKKK